MCFIIIYSIIYIQTKLLQCYYREIVNIQARLCDVQGPGDDDLGSPSSRGRSEFAKSTFGDE